MTSLPLSHDAATVIALAGSALPFADSADEEVERWLRPLRLYGEAGTLLQGAGVSESRLSAASNHLEHEAARRPEDAVAAVTTEAAQLARQRGATVIGTADILVAVMRCYPRAFVQALESRGCDRWELVDRVVERRHSALR